MPLEYLHYKGTQVTKYKGFARYKMGEVPEGCSLVIVKVAGGFELWIVEGKNGLKDLRAYYQNDLGKDYSLPFQEFNCTSAEKDMKSDRWF